MLWNKIIAAAAWAALAAVSGCAPRQAATGPEGWTPHAPRAEIRPAFFHEPFGGPGGGGCLVVSAERREGQDGWWAKTFPVEGGRPYRFSARRKATGVAVPRRSCVARIVWRDEQGRPVRGEDDVARPVYPRDGDADADGWTEVADTYVVPSGAAAAVVELGLRWAPGGTVRWSDVSLLPADSPPSRKVRLAAVHFRPGGGKTPQDNREQFAPLIAEAARQKADLVCLGECLTDAFTGMSHVEAAEPVPGPSTEYFGSLARRHNLYVVAGILERQGELVYNTAVLLGPDGRLVGSYRKVCLPREEIEAGVAPGADYPVFDTRFGRVGMMVCWDVHFPEVARNLAARGAEVIALPIWGGNPTLAAARAIENQVFLVTSTYSDRADWMKTGVWDPRGRLIAEGEKWGTVVTAEVDLGPPVPWLHLGDFRGRIPRERPVGEND